MSSSVPTVYVHINDDGDVVAEVANLIGARVGPRELRAVSSTGAITSVKHGTELPEPLPVHQPHYSPVRSDTGAACAAASRKVWASDVAMVARIAMGMLCGRAWMKSAPSVAGWTPQQLAEELASDRCRLRVDIGKFREAYALDGVLHAVAAASSAVRFGEADDSSCPNGDHPASLLASLLQFKWLPPTAYTSCKRGADSLEGLFHRAVWSGQAIMEQPHGVSALIFNQKHVGYLSDTATQSDREEVKVVVGGQEKTLQPNHLIFVANRMLVLDKYLSNPDRFRLYVTKRFECHADMFIERLEDRGSRELIFMELLGAMKQAQTCLDVATLRTHIRDLSEQELDGIQRVAWRMQSWSAGLLFPKLSGATTSDVVNDGTTMRMVNYAAKPLSCAAERKVAVDSGNSLFDDTTADRL